MRAVAWLGALDRVADPSRGTALAEAERSGSALVFKVRAVALVVIGIWLWVSVSEESRLFYLSVVAGFFVTGLIGFVGSRLLRDPMPLSFLVILADVALLTWVSITPGPGAGPLWTPHLNLRFGNFTYFFVYLVGVALTYSPARVAFAAGAVVVCWSTGATVVAMQPETVTLMTAPAGVSDAEVMAYLMNPRFFSMVTVGTQLVLFCLTAMILTIAVRRSRQLVVRRIAAEGDRANLARYFPPEVADRLARDPHALDQVRRQRVVVVFMDIVGFTSLSEAISPEAVMALLRDYRARVAETVFAHGGSLEKFIGDAVKITFGTPEPRPDDALRALAAAHALIEGMARWSTERVAGGQPEIAVGIGIHCGDAAVGNIGDGRTLEYTVIGDTVNVASRLERLTRSRGASIVVSQEFLASVEAARGTGINPALGFEPDGDVILRNRVEPMQILSWRNPESPAPRPEMVRRAHEAED